MRIEVLPHDAGTFLCQSRTHPEDYYLVDFTGTQPECACTGQQTRKKDGYKCWHIKHIELILGRLTHEPR
jgi:hypothetical protein